MLMYWWTLACSIHESYNMSLMQFLGRIECGKANRFGVLSKAAGRPSGIIIHIPVASRRQDRFSCPFPRDSWTAGIYPPRSIGAFGWFLETDSMGQRHQIYVIAKVAGRYRGLAALHNQWLYGSPAVARCRRALQVFRAAENRVPIQQKLLAARSRPEASETGS